MMEWNSNMDDVPMNGDKVLLYTKSHGICEAWFAKGEWSEATPNGPAEYDGDVWVCCDDEFQIEVEFNGDKVFHGCVTHWATYEEPTT